MDAAPIDPQQTIEHIDQKAVRLSALLRDIDNHPLILNDVHRGRLDQILEQLECRIAATRALMQQERATIA